MAASVRELTGSIYRSPGSEQQPVEGQDGHFEQVVVRDGSFLGLEPAALVCRCANREGVSRRSTWNHVGFRLYIPLSDSQREQATAR